MYQMQLVQRPQEAFFQVPFLCQCLTARVSDASPQSAPVDAKLTRQENLIHLCQPSYQTSLCLVGYFF